MRDDRGTLLATRRSLRRGSRRLRAAATAGVLALAMLASAACDTADAANRPAPPKSGGTLRVVLTAWPEHLDPQKVQSVTEANISRLITRGLTTFKSEPDEASEIVGDLATDTGRPSEGNRIWEFTLKNGVKWEDGSPVTCAQLKYGVERRFSSLFEAGLPYPRSYLEDNKEPYKGPYSPAGAELDSVQCVDQRTIRYRLKQPVGDFGYAVATSVFAPVPEGENRDEYDRRPVSNGPYMIKESSDDRILMVRNPHWNSVTDQVRKQYPDQILFTLNSNSAVLTNALIQDQGDDQSTVMLDTNIASNFVQQVVNDPVLSARTATGPSGVRYFAINTKRIPRLECRQALAFGFNKRKYRSAMGGSMFGDLATGMIPPALASYLAFDHYGTKTNPDGQRDRAIQILQDAEKAGKPCKTVIRLGYRDLVDIRRYVATIVDTYGRIGIQVQLVPLEAGPYWGTISDSGGTYDMVYAGWVPDWANGSAVLPPLFHSKYVLPPGEQGNFNFSFLQDPEIDRLIDEALAESDLNAQYRLWGSLDSKLAEMAVTIPVLYTNQLRLMGSNVRGAFIHPQWGQPDLSALGLADPAKSPAA